ncbi:TPA: hypothetical protein HLU32_19835 [Escherichia coli]|nr:hypothetical protein [Escherichia coli]HAJ4256744.1 hypothetical protein [Escherichia coli]HAJ4383625.1 hypothetical protein [Escherichia coli]
MIRTDYPRQLREKVVTAIRCSFISCTNDEERYIAGCSIVEFLTAMEFTAEEAIEVLRMADGSDSETDEVIDRMIKEFEDEV